MKDPYSPHSADASSPALDAIAVTPSDTALTTIPKALYVGGSGNLVVTMIGGATVTFTAVSAGSILPIRVSHVRAASTATAIVALI